MAQYALNLIEAIWEAKHIKYTALACGERCKMAMLMASIIDSCEGQIMEGAQKFFTTGSWLLKAIASVKRRTMPRICSGR